MYLRRNCPVTPRHRSFANRSSLGHNSTSGGAGPRGGCRRAWDIGSDATSGSYDPAHVIAALRRTKTPANATVTKPLLLHRIRENAPHARGGTAGARTPA